MSYSTGAHFKCLSGLQAAPSIATNGPSGHTTRFRLGGVDVKTNNGG